MRIAFTRLMTETIGRNAQIGTDSNRSKFKE